MALVNKINIFDFFINTKKAFKNYTCFISRRFGLFLIHLQSENKATLVSNSFSFKISFKILVSKLVSNLYV